MIFGVMNSGSAEAAESHQNDETQVAHHGEAQNAANYIAGPSAFSLALSPGFWPADERSSRRVDSKVLAALPRVVVPGQVQAYIRQLA